MTRTPVCRVFIDRRAGVVGVETAPGVSYHLPQPAGRPYDLPSVAARVAAAGSVDLRLWRAGRPSYGTLEDGN